VLLSNRLVAPKASLKFAAILSLSVGELLGVVTVLVELLAVSESAPNFTFPTISPQVSTTTASVTLTAASSPLLYSLYFLELPKHFSTGLRNDVA